MVTAVGNPVEIEGVGRALLHPPRHHRPICGVWEVGFYEQRCDVHMYIQGPRIP